MLVLKQLLKTYWWVVAIVITLALGYICYRIEQYGESIVQAKWDKAESDKLKSSVFKKEEEIKYTYGLDVDNLAKQANINLDTTNAKKEAQNETLANPLPISCNLTAKRLSIYKQVAKHKSSAN